jgi:hypothetical protein
MATITYKFKGWPPSKEHVVRRNLRLLVNGEERKKWAVSPPVLVVPLGDFEEGDEIALESTPVDRAGNKGITDTWTHTVTDVTPPVDDSSGEFIEGAVPDVPESIAPPRPPVSETDVPDAAKPLVEGAESGVPKEPSTTGGEGTGEAAGSAASVPVPGETTETPSRRPRR